MEFGKAINFDVIIRPSNNNGFIVEVGCGRFVYQSKNILLADLEEYLSNPKAIEKQYDAAYCDNNPQPAHDENPEPAHD